MQKRKEMDYRIEKDTIGEVQVPKDAYWGAQTERSRSNFKIGAPSSMPKEILSSLAIVKKAAAFTNCDLGVLSSEKRDLIARVCDEIIRGEHWTEFPLVIWQTGSGTQTNMNVNEVISNRALVLNGGKLGDVSPVHPNDDVNKSQSSNDTFPTAMHISAVELIEKELLPNLCLLLDSFREKEQAFEKVVKIGRTHMMDATPLTFGQEFSGYTTQLSHAIESINRSLPHLKQLALGGTAVGTGLNTPKGYATLAAKYISEFTKINFITAENKFEALASHDALVASHGALKQLAVALYKIGQDLRLLASGPRSGIGEILLPENEPGSSIMPGKVNPTQIEALTMVCAQVLGNDTTIAFAATQGNFELNVFKPVIAFNYIESARLLSDACNSFRIHCVDGLQLNQSRITELLERSLMLVTALNPHIGYDNAAKIAKAAHANGTTLKEEAVRLKLVDPQDFDQWVDPEKMV